MTISADRLRSLGQPLQADRWEVTFPYLPGTTSDTSEFTVRARGTQLPGFDVETAEVFFKGIRVKYATRVLEKGNIRISFEESIDMKIYNAFLKWKALTATRNPALYKTVIAITIEDASGNQKAEVTLGGVFPTDLPDTEFDYDNPQPVKLDISFSYDWFLKTG